MRIPSTKFRVILSRLAYSMADLVSKKSVFSQFSNDTAEILLPTAVHLKERLTVNQSVNLRGQHSDRQKHTVWSFCQRQSRVQGVGTTTVLRASSGRMVMQPAADFLVGGSNPGRANAAAPPPTTAGLQESTLRPETLRLAALPFDRGLM